MDKRERSKRVKKVNKDPVAEQTGPGSERAQGDKMCRVPVKNLKAVCDWLNSDEMPLPQNQIRQALALLFVAEVIED